MVAPRPSLLNMARSTGKDAKITRDGPTQNIFWIKFFIIYSPNIIVETLFE
jgi:hypothetical protein